MKGFRSHHHPPSLDFSWRNVRKPDQKPDQKQPIAVRKDREKGTTLYTGTMTRGPGEAAEPAGLPFWTHFLEYKTMDWVTAAPLVIVALILVNLVSFVFLWRRGRLSSLPSRAANA
jgi:hypothetical protein